MAKNLFKLLSFLSKSAFKIINFSLKLILILFIIPPLLGKFLSIVLFAFDSFLKLNLKFFDSFRFDFSIFDLEGSYLSTVQSLVLTCSKRLSIVGDPLGGNRVYSPDNFIKWSMWFSIRTHSRSQRWWHRALQLSILNSLCVQGGHFCRVVLVAHLQWGF